MDLSVIVVNYNTRELVLECLASLRAETTGIEYEVLVVDNDSPDGSAAAIRERFPDLDLIEPGANLGFAEANNLASERARGEWVLLLNPDTVVLDGAVHKLLAFARKSAQPGIFGGRTLFADLSLNPSSCWGRITPWSAFCEGTGLSWIFKGTRLFDPESLGSWPRDSVREVDIVSGCFFLLRRRDWEALGGFRSKVFPMYGEEADLCLRARALGLRGFITPDATIVHLGGASERVRADKFVRLFLARTRLVREHWPARLVPFGLWMARSRVAMRAVAATLIARLAPNEGREERARVWREIRARRGEWLQPSPPVPAAAA